MKAFISVDLEGLPYVVIPGHLGLKGSLYNEARKIATDVTLIVAEELNKNGFEKVIVADSHGPMVNLLVDNLPDYIEIIRGNPRPTSMVAGVDECDVALFLGYHAKMGTAKSTFDHTYSGGTIHRLEVNDIPVSEYLLNAYTAGEHNVPVILVAGDAQLMEDDVKKFTPWTETVVLKESYSRISAKSPAMGIITKNLKLGTQKAITNFKEKKVKILNAGKDITVRVTFRTSLMADVADLLPTVKRIDGLTVEYQAKNMIEGYNIFQVLVAAAGSTNSLMQYLQ
ncbi:MAG: peptide transporter [Asgard group archaeon]|nr:peptide transporter [Asgard group archaeon]